MLNSFESNNFLGYLQLSAKQSFVNTPVGTSNSIVLGRQGISASASASAIALISASAFATAAINESPPVRTQCLMLFGGYSADKSLLSNALHICQASDLFAGKVTWKNLAATGGFTYALFLYQLYAFLFSYIIIFFPTPLHSSVTVHTSSL